MKKPSNDNWRNLLKQLKEDAVSALSEKDRAIFWNLQVQKLLFGTFLKVKSINIAIMIIRMFLKN